MSANAWGGGRTVDLAVGESVQLARVELPQGHALRVQLSSSAPGNGTWTVVWGSGGIMRQTIAAPSAVDTIDATGGYVEATWTATTGGEVTVGLSVGVVGAPCAR